MLLVFDFGFGINSGLQRFSWRRARKFNVTDWKVQTTKTLFKSQLKFHFLGEALPRFLVRLSYVSAEKLESLNNSEKIILKYIFKKQL